MSLHPRGHGVTIDGEIGHPAGWTVTPQPRRSSLPLQRQSNQERQSLQWQRQSNQEWQPSQWHRQSHQEPAQHPHLQLNQWQPQAQRQEQLVSHPQRQRLSSQPQLEQLSSQPHRQRLSSQPQPDQWRSSQRLSSQRQAQRESSQQQQQRDWQSTRQESSQRQPLELHSHPPCGLSAITDGTELSGATAAHHTRDTGGGPLRGTSHAQPFSVLEGKTRLQRKSIWLSACVLVLAILSLVFGIPWFEMLDKDYVLGLTGFELPMGVHWRCTLLQCSLSFGTLASKALRVACDKVQREIVRKNPGGKIDQLETFLRDPCEGKPKVIPLLTVFKRCGDDDDTGTRLAMGAACEDGYLHTLTVISLAFIGLLIISSICCLIAVWQLALTMGLLGASSPERQAKLVKDRNLIVKLMGCATGFVCAACLAFACWNGIVGDTLIEETLLGVVIHAPGRSLVSNAMYYLVPGRGYLCFVALGLFNGILGLWARRIVKGLAPSEREGRQVRADARQESAPESCEMAQMPFSIRGPSIWHGRHQSSPFNLSGRT